MIENVADPSHVFFAHHGLQGRRENANPYPLEITAECGDGRRRRFTPIRPPIRGFMPKWVQAVRAG